MKRVVNLEDSVTLEAHYALTLKSSNFAEWYPTIILEVIIIGIPLTLKLYYSR